MKKPKRHMTSRLVMMDGANCWICGMRMKFCDYTKDPLAASKDHLMPESQGGSSSIKNFRLAHRLCNFLRGTAADLTPALRESCKAQVQSIIREKGF